MILLTIVFAIQLAVSGLLLKFACWLYNFFFTGSQPVPRDYAPAKPLVSNQTVGFEVAADNEQINPFASPRQTAQPIVANQERQIVVPTLGVSVGFGLLTGMQLFVFGILLLSAFNVLEPGIAVGLSLIMTFAATATFVTKLLASNFARGTIVTGIYYGLLLVLASPLIVLILVAY